MSAGRPRRARGGLRVVVTAGPTREHIDAVRYLSNESSGRMGFAIAAEARRRGHRVTLIAGPVHLATPQGVRRVDVTSARDMLSALRPAFREADALFMAAAVADFRPARRRSGKWRAKDATSAGGGARGGAQGGARTVLELVQNPDLLASVARRKGSRLVVAFALETADGGRRALAKLRRKNADYVVLNDASALNAERTSVTILDGRGEVRRIRDRSKAAVARILVGLLD